MENFEGGTGYIGWCLDGHKGAYRTLSGWLGKLADQYAQCGTLNCSQWTIDDIGGHPVIRAADEMVSKYGSCKLFLTGAASSIASAFQSPLIMARVAVALLGILLFFPRFTVAWARLATHAADWSADGSTGADKGLCVRSGSAGSLIIVFARDRAGWDEGMGS